MTIIIISLGGHIVIQILVTSNFVQMVNYAIQISSIAKETTRGYYIASVHIIKMLSMYIAIQICISCKFARMVFSNAQEMMMTIQIIVLCFNFKIQTARPDFKTTSPSPRSALNSGHFIPNPAGSPVTEKEHFLGAQNR